MRDSNLASARRRQSQAPLGLTGLATARGAAKRPTSACGSSSLDMDEIQETNRVQVTLLFG